MEKITRELLREIRRTEGPFKVSIRPNPSDRLETLVLATRYKGLSSEKISLIAEEIQRLFVPICNQLETYGLISGKTYVSDEVIRNVSALLSRSQIESLASQDYIGQIDLNFQKGLPF